MIEGSEGLLEVLFEFLFGWCLEDAPKPVRYGCTGVLLALVLGLFLWALWAALT